MPNLRDELLTAAPGAYWLLVALDRGLCLAGTSLDPARLAPGRYIYCGSAYGPGGLRARLRRHLRADKRPRWHADRLTLAGRVLGLGLAPGGAECALVEDLRRRPGVEVPVPGFGSSDCRRCPAHLLRLPVGAEPWPGAADVSFEGFEVLVPDGRGGLAPARLRKRAEPA